jgi:undecaprenyl-diphosphatase
MSSRAALRRRRKALGRLDRRLLANAAGARTPARDRVMTTASQAANRSKLWVAIAGVLVVSGREQRAAAASGLLGIGIAATLANGPLKFLWRRDRPPGHHAPGAPPLLPLPRTFSFPSGHAASACAFAVGVSRELPSAAPVLVPLAATVAYSRVHTGVHYPSDVAVGGAVGVASGLAAATVIRHARRRAALKRSPSQAPAEGFSD